MGEGARNRIPFSANTGANDGQNASIGEAFEFFMAEWHLPPDYIMSHWTEELLILMIDKLIERKRKETAALQGHSYSGRVVSDAQFFREAGIKVRKVNRGN